MGMAYRERDTILMRTKAREMRSNKTFINFELVFFDSYLIFRTKGLQTHTHTIPTNEFSLGIQPLPVSHSAECMIAGEKVGFRTLHA